MIFTKRGRLFFKALSLILVIALLFIGMSVSAHKDTEPKTDIGAAELWTPEESDLQGSMPGDLSLKELAIKELSLQDTPEVVSAESIEENEHVNRLWEQEEDLNTILFQNRDGTKTMYYFAEAVKYIDASGKVCDKNSFVTDIIDKPAYRQNYGFVSDANDIKTYFPKSLSSDVGVLLESGDIKIELIPASAKGLVSKQLYDALVKDNLITEKAPQVQENTLTAYDHRPEVYNPDKGLLHWIHIAISNAKAFVLGTYHGLPAKYLDAYLGEFCFRFSRRSFAANLFDRLAFALSASSVAVSMG